MKTTRFFLAAAIIAAMASCQKDATVESGNGALDLEPMTISTGSETKTTISGTDIHWTEGDAVTVFDNMGGEHTFTAAAVNGSSASFTGSVNAGTTGFLAVYPAGNAGISDGKLTVNILADQTSMTGSFAEEHNISVAKGVKVPGNETVEGVTFMNVCSWLKFTLPEYIGDATKVTVSSASVIAGAMEVTYEDAPACTVSEDGSTSISMTGEYAAGSTFWFVVAPVTLDGISVNVETAKGSYSMSTEASFEMTAGQYRNLGTLELKKVSATGASAAHTYSNGTLTGTAVTVSLDIPEETLPYVTALDLQIAKADGTIVRTLSKTTASAVETIAADDAWPYLPAGDYTVSGTYTLSGVSVKELKPVSFSISEKPVFEVKTNDAYTSYSKYSAGDPAGANALDGSTIYNVGATVTVADAILNNANYPSLVLTDNGSAVSAGDLSGRSWSSHTIKASYTLDGVTEEDEVSCEVTGLPYSYDFVDGSLDQYTADGWTMNGKLRVSNESLLGRTEALVLNHRRYSKGVFGIGKFDEAEKGFAVSPKFHTPATLNIQSCILRSNYYASGDQTRTGYVGAVSSTTSSNKNSITYSTTGGNSLSESVAGSGVWMNAFELSSTSPHISIDCDDRSSSSDLGSYYFLHEAHFRYAE